MFSLRGRLYLAGKLNVKFTSRLLVGMFRFVFLDLSGLDRISSSSYSPRLFHFSLKSIPSDTQIAACENTFVSADFAHLRVGVVACGVAWVFRRWVLKSSRGLVRGLSQLISRRCLLFIALVG